MTRAGAKTRLRSDFGFWNRKSVKCDVIWSIKSSCRTCPAPTASAESGGKSSPGLQRDRESMHDDDGDATADGSGATQELSSERAAAHGVERARKEGRKEGRTHRYAQTTTRRYLKAPIAAKHS